MSRLAFTLSLAAAVLAGCATEHKVAPAPAPVVVAPATPGAVVVAPAAAQPLRAGLRMDDGTIQYVDTAAGGLAIGDRVAITSDGNMRHPAP